MAEELRERHVKANSFFRGVFGALTCALFVTRVIMLVYAVLSPTSWPHLAHASEIMGSQALMGLESAAVVSFAFLSLYVWSVRPLFLHVPLLLNSVLLIVAAVPPQVGDSLWFVFYFPGFSVFYGLVLWYALRLILDPSLDRSLDDILRRTPGVQHV